MRCYAALIGVIAFLAVSTCAAPCRQLYRRQDLLDATTDPIDGTTDPLAGNSVNNLVGNSETTIDDSINLTDNSIDYPDDSELTGNTGTAVSGNNNDIMPIINAPVTVIINSAGGDSKGQSAGQLAPPLAGPPIVNSASTTSQQQSLPQQQQQQQQQQVQQQQQQQLYSPLDANIQNLIQYALLVSQNNLNSKVAMYP
ncbi:hypothetical protein J3B02_001707 [Coemansia erecta]|nr:hypothetical protein J3B02_001707 [Coemansia erecta]